MPSGEKHYQTRSANEVRIVEAIARGFTTRQAIIEETREWLEARAASSPALQKYLDAWGDWQSPWA